jgi:hypothetical protein
MINDDIIYVLLERYRAVYIETPKVACTSIKTALAGVVGVDLGDTAGNPHEAQWPVPAALPARLGPRFPDLFVFGFVRNPWDRLVSCYRDKRRRRWRRSPTPRPMPTSARSIGS